MAGPKPYRILFVCSGNICRSPMAESVMRRALTKAGLDRYVDVDSAGTLSFRIGEGPDKRAIHEAFLRGVSMTGLTARQVRMKDFEDFDLILAMDRTHIESLKRVVPANAAHKIQLFMSFVSENAEPQDIPDPIDGDEDDFRKTMDLIELGCAALLKSLSNNILGVKKKRR